MSKMPVRTRRVFETTRGERYVSVLAKIISRGEDGRPRDVALYYDDESVELGQGDAFLVIFARESALSEFGGDSGQAVE